MSHTETEQQKPTTNKRIAAIDLGSNSFHMTLAELTEHGLRDYHREKRKVRLASGLNDEGILDEEAQQRALETLKTYADILADFKPDQVRVVGTYTFRAAKNISELIKAAKKVLPYQIEVLSGAEEARLIYQGVSHAQHLDQDTLVIDIGGGSTEVIVGRNFDTKLLHSCNVGCVSVTTKFFSDGEITEKKFRRAIMDAEQQLAYTVNGARSLNWQMAIGSSGTIKALSACAEALGLSNGVLTLEVLNQIKNRLVDAKTIEKIKLKGLAEDRVPVICGGLSVLIAAFEMLDISAMNYSDAALREGLLFEVQERLKHNDVRDHTVGMMAKRFGGDIEQSFRVESDALAMYDKADVVWEFSDREYRRLLRWSSQLFEIGYHINRAGSHRHAHYIITNANMAGFNREQQSLLAYILLSYRKSLKTNLLPQLNTFNERKVYRLILILRISILLNQFRQSTDQQDYQIGFTSDGMKLTFLPSWRDQQALFESGLEQEKINFAKVGIELDYSFQTA